MAQVLEDLKEKMIGYKNCLLKNVLKIKIKGCGKIVDECAECQEDLCFLNSLIAGLQVAIDNDDEQSSLRIAHEIEKICESCYNCS